MNGPNSTINDASGIFAIDNDVKYDDKKRQSLTLPLLNVEYTMAENNEKSIDSTTNSPKMENSDETMQGSSNKMKKIYESDDVFIQTIFSQTIKSTTATPSDDEPSQGYDPFKRLASSPSQDEFLKSYETPTDKMDLNGTDDVFDVAKVISVHDPSESDEPIGSNDPNVISNEPMFVYFHQTIEEDDDDPPNDLKDFNKMPPELLNANANPINILTNVDFANGIHDHFSSTHLSNDVESCHSHSNDTDDDELTESLNQSSSNQSDVQSGDETIVTTTDKVLLVEKLGRKKSMDGEHVKSGTTTKKKSKKSKKSSEKENISVRSSFSKFDALQKQNMKNVRTDEGVKLNGSTEGEKLCKSCGKIVYKMEEMKAEKSVWHKNCFRCSQCSKPLSVDTFESHEGVLYCKLHFKSLFSPKAVEDTEPETPSKPELIIRESQPIELPPDVVRSSDKTDLGLSELQQLNVKERYNIFENGKREESHQLLDRDERIMKRGSTVLSKLAKFKAKGMDIGTAKDSIPVESCDDDDEAFDEDCEDIDLLRAKQAIDRDFPVCIANMNDIKSKFESGHSQSREERREERKQEIQNIRSRLFMGKQAKIKEMYQQAIAESEQCVRASDKKPDVDIDTSSIKNKFENGEVFKEETNHSHPVDDSAVFEHGLGKQSRSIFMEIDAKASASPQTPASPTTPKRVNQINPVWPPEPKEKINIDDVIKCDEKVDEVKIKTADVSSKFKFFETFKPKKQDRKPFRITPPRDGAIIANQNDDDDETNELDNQQTEHNYSDASIKSAQRSSTTTKMLSVFRQMEENERVHRSDDGPKPLKSFTPPPDDSRRLNHRNSESGSEYTDSEEEEDDDESEDQSEQDENDNHVRDESLQQAQAAARAKHLRAKFEKWEQKEIQREQEQFRLYDGEDQSQIESTQSIRAKFESLKDAPPSPSREKIEVHRFV